MGQGAKIKHIAHGSPMVAAQIAAYFHGIVG
jgi:hypothetical protein